jgi:hypothetical protein
MDIKQIYREETELDVYTTVSLDDGASFSNEYVKWLESKLMHSNEQLILSSVGSRLISEAILNDKQLQSLHAERVKIHSLAPRTIVMKENGEVGTLWIDENNYPPLSKIDEMIKRRTKQIKSLYS